MVHAENLYSILKLVSFDSCLTAEADKVFCHLVMFFTVFSLWMHKMKYGCYQQSSVIHGWFVYKILG